MDFNTFINIYFNWMPCLFLIITVTWLILTDSWKHQSKWVRKSCWFRIINKMSEIFPLTIKRIILLYFIIIYYDWMIMTIQILSILIILIGAMFLLLSFLPAIKIWRNLSGRTRRKWHIIIYLMGFFILVHKFINTMTY